MRVEYKGIEYLRSVATFWQSHLFFHVCLETRHAMELSIVNLLKTRMKKFKLGSENETALGNVHTMFSVVHK